MQNSWQISKRKHSTINIIFRHFNTSIAQSKLFFHFTIRCSSIISIIFSRVLFYYSYHFLFETIFLFREIIIYLLTKKESEKKFKTTKLYKKTVWTRSIRRKRIISRKVSERNSPGDKSHKKNMSTAIMQTGAMGWDYKFHDWNDSTDDIQQLKVSKCIFINSSNSPVQCFFFSFVFVF